MDAAALKTRACETVDRLRDELIRVSHEIHAHPELAFEEHRASALLADTLEKAGIPVERGVYGLETAFEGVLGANEGPCVAILAEYDALPEIGHACGHNIIGTAAIFGGLALGALQEQHRVHAAR